MPILSVSVQSSPHCLPCTSALGNPTGLCEERGTLSWPTSVCGAVVVWDHLTLDFQADAAVFSLEFILYPLGLGTLFSVLQFPKPENDPTTLSLTYVLGLS